MKTVDYRDCKTVFSLQSLKDAASEGTTDPTKPRVSFCCWRGQVLVACGAAPPWGRRPPPPSCPGHLLKRLLCCAAPETRAPPAVLRDQASADVPGPETRLRRGGGGGGGGAAGCSPRGSIGLPEPRRQPCRKPPVCLGPAQGPRWEFFFFSREGAEVGVGTVTPGKVAFSPEM